ncbi:MAG: hypothetical protein J1G30_04310 [Spirochaetales bacterium]|nr:hypothetical protein [Spirochaetales bacterium]
MNEEIDKALAFFGERLKKLREWLEDNYTAELHNYYYETVDIVKDLEEIKKLHGSSRL